MNRVLSIVRDEKVCNICNASKPLTEFYKQGNYHAAQCKVCRRVKAKKDRAEGRIKSSAGYCKDWREKMRKDPVKHAKYLDRKIKYYNSPKGKSARFLRVFGISFDEVMTLHAKQYGLCANMGCSRPISVTAEAGEHKAVVDHCHVTGKVRALLCIRCNCLLGHVEISRPVVIGLFDYLNKYNIV